MAVKQRIIVVGLGSIGYRHARLLAAHPDLDVELCDADVAAVRQAQETLNIPTAYTNLDSALDSQPDMLVIATPHHLHAAQTIQTLEAGVHVLCEKPMSDSLAAAHQMQAAARSSDRVLTFGFHLHFHPGLLRVKQLIEDGTIGTVLHAHCRVGSYVTLVNSVSRYQSQMFGALLLDYAHQPDALYWLLGQQPTAVHAQAFQAGHLEFSANPNVMLLTCQYASPLLTTIHLNYAQMPERHEYEIVGDKGWVILDATTGHVRHGDRASNEVFEEQIPTQRDAVLSAEHQAFLDAVAGKRTPESPADTAIVSMEVFDAALQALKQALKHA